eukprot:TRINITY_DN1299_c0_g2_i4.p2 TRINITY_DN1299_c0_g2~~TRINITY_DN1299_c0_g2_i4.p2  ORF type:complete len:373 (-),score=25.46 TRINITY_DN1299_c0_g2_i4:325-1443(-)
MYCGWNTAKGQNLQGYVYRRRGIENSLDTYNRGKGLASKIFDVFSGAVLGSMCLVSSQRARCASAFGPIGTQNGDTFVTAVFYAMQSSLLKSFKPQLLQTRQPSKVGGFQLLRPRNLFNLPIRKKFPVIKYATPSEQFQAAEEEEEEEEDDAEVCYPAFVSYDNQQNQNFTVVQLEINDYPGLVRVIAWVIEGLDLVVQNALLSTTDEGLVSDTFYLTDSRNRKLSDREAEDVVDRLREFVTYCSPDNVEMDATELYQEGVGRVSNTADPLKTEVIVNQNGNPPSLLQLACAITGAGAVIREAVVQSCENCAEGVSQPDFEAGKGTLFRFLVTDRAGNKLDYQRAQSLLYTLSIMHGRGSVQTQVPRLTAMH